MVVPSPCSDGILSSPHFLSVMFLSHFMVDGAWCVLVVPLPSGNVTVRWRRKRYRSSSGFLHHHLLRCYHLLAQLGFSFNNWLDRWAWLTSTSSGLQQKRWRRIAVYHVAGRAALCMTAWCYGFIGDCASERHWGHHTVIDPCLQLQWWQAEPVHSARNTAKTVPLGAEPLGWVLRACRDLGLFCAVTWLSFLSLWQRGISISFSDRYDIIIWRVFLRLLSCHREDIILMLLCYGMPREGNGLSGRTLLSVGSC